MNSVLILVFNILASSQAKPDADTNMHIEHAQISMPAEKSGGGDYASQGNPDTNLHINKASIVMPESSGGLTFQTFSTFYNILLQISSATCISGAVILAERFTQVTYSILWIQCFYCRRWRRRLCFSGQSRHQPPHQQSKYPIAG